jgi:hypothetical protein
MRMASSAINRSAGRAGGRGSSVELMIFILAINVLIAGVFIQHGLEKVAAAIRASKDVQ